VAEHEVCRLDELASGTIRCFEVGATKVAIARIDDELYAIDDTCSHEEFSLSEGELFVDERAVECAKHGSVFDLKTGEPRSLPATKPVAVYPVRVRDGVVVVELPG
jgi:3-phenylpropionate/trans-cinnamate dioxygenase ferredoxin subunit